MIFVDTGAWYASAVPDDVNHRLSRDWLNNNSEPLMTTDYVVDETLTLLKVRGHAPLAVAMGESLFAGELGDIVLVTEDDIQRAWLTFKQFRDKKWSFTDCTSKIIMERLGVVRAFSFDYHFRQFGSIVVEP
jgi:uncharacterized protein